MSAVFVKGMHYKVSFEWGEIARNPAAALKTCLYAAEGSSRLKDC